jgi:uncharacterized protein YutE (UPF0331/DUF86 family)
MYFVDRNKLEERLHYIENLLSFLQTRSSYPTSLGEILAFERAVHMLIEAKMDVGNQMIDGFIMRDPGSYEDIIEILRDEQVLQINEAVQLVQWIRLRKELVAQYTQVDIEMLWNVYEQTKETINHFPIRIREFLDEHLGPVSAFLPGEGK